MALGWRRNYSRYQKFFLNLYAVYKGREDVKAFLEILLSLTTTIFFVLFAIRPTFLTIAQLFKDIDTKDDVVSQLDKKIVDLNKVQDLLVDKGSEISLLETGVPESPAVDTYVRQLEGLAGRHGVLLAGVTIDEVALLGKKKATQTTEDKDASLLPENSESLKVSISASGSYQNLIEFAKDVENLRRPMIVEEFSMSANTNNSEGNTIVLNVKGLVAFTNEKQN